MTFTYDLTTDIGKVRLYINDRVNTHDDRAHFSDEEIQTFLTAEGSVACGAAMALEAWAAEYSSDADSEKIGDYAYSRSIASKMLAAAARLRANAAAALTAPAFGWGNYDLIAAAEDDEEEFEI